MINQDHFMTYFASQSYNNVFKKVYLLLGSSNFWFAFRCDQRLFSISYLEINKNNEYVRYM